MLIIIIITIMVMIMIMITIMLNLKSAEQLSVRAESLGAASRVVDSGGFDQFNAIIIMVMVMVMVM